MRRMRVRLPNADWYKNVQHVRRGATTHADFTPLEQNQLQGGFLKTDKGAADLTVGDMILCYGIEPADPDVMTDRMVSLSIALDGPMLYEVARVSANMTWVPVLAEPVAALSGMPRPSRAAWALARLDADMRRKPRIIDEDGVPMPFSARAENLVLGFLLRNSAQYGLSANTALDGIRKRFAEADSLFLQRALQLWISDMADLCNVSIPTIERTIREVLPTAVEAAAASRTRATPAQESRRSVELLWGEE